MTSAMMGHNRPPEDPIDAICAAHEGARMEAEIWLDGKSEINSEATYEAARRVREDLRTFRVEVEKGQKAAAAPFVQAANKERARWKPTIDDLKLQESGMQALLDSYAAILAAEKEAARKAAWESAEKARKEAEEAARAAAADDLEARREAQEAAQEALIAEKKAQAAQREKVKGLRTVTRTVVKDHVELARWLWANDREEYLVMLEERARKLKLHLPEIVEQVTSEEVR